MSEISDLEEIDLGASPSARVRKFRGKTVAGWKRNMKLTTHVRGVIIGSKSGPRRDISLPTVNLPELTDE